MALGSTRGTSGWEPSFQASFECVVLKLSTRLGHRLTRIGLVSVASHLRHAAATPSIPRQTEYPAPLLASLQNTPQDEMGGVRCHHLLESLRLHRRVDGDLPMRTRQASLGSSHQRSLSGLRCQWLRAVYFQRLHRHCGSRATASCAPFVEYRAISETGSHGHISHRRIVRCSEGNLAQTILDSGLILS